MDASKLNTPGDFVTGNKIWKCVNCGQLMIKKSLGTIWMHLESITKVAGTGTCSICGATYPQQAIYGGKYDVKLSLESLALEEQPQSVSIVVFLLRSRTPPSDVEIYCRRIFAKKFPRSIMESNYIVGYLDDLTPEEALALYQSHVHNHQLPHLGKQIDWYKGIGSDGNDIVALFFNMYNR
jgi:hypothetical protein